MRIEGAMLWVDKETGNIVLGAGETLVVMTRGEWSKMIVSAANAREHLAFTPDHIPSWPKK